MISAVLKTCTEQKFEIPDLSAVELEVRDSYMKYIEYGDGTSMSLEATQKLLKWMKY